MDSPRTAFVFPGLNGCAHVAEHLPLLRLPGFATRWQLVTNAFAAHDGFAAFSRALHAGHELPMSAATWTWRALAVTAMQLAMAAELEQRGEHAHWLCSYSIGDVARSCHADITSFGEVVAFAAALPPLPAAAGTTAAMHCATPSLADRLHAHGDELRLCTSRLSPRFLLVAGARTAVEGAVVRAHALGARALAVGQCPLHASEQVPLAQILLAALARRGLRPAQRPTFSTLWGRAVTIDDDVGAEFAANVAAPCDFATTVRRLHVEHGVTRFIDLGPGRHAQRFVRHHDLPLTAIAASELLTLKAARA